MKNFKKVIAFLMVAAMTLGMGLTAFATSTDSAVDANKVEALTAAKVEEAKAGETVTIKVLTNQSLAWNAGKLVITLNSECVKTGKDDVVNDANEYLDAVWKMKAGAQVNYFPADGRFEASAAGVSANNPKSFVVDAGATVAELNVVLAKDVKAGDKIATISCEFITDESSTPGTKITINPKDVDVVVSEKVTQSSSDQPSTDQPSTDKPVSDNPTNAPTTAAGGDNNAAQQPTTKALPKAEDIKTVTNALEACADLIENGNYNAVLNVAKKLDASCFTSADSYNKFAAALKDYEAVLAKQGATDQEKIDAYNKMIELMQENVLTQKGKDTLMTNVKAALSSTPATTKAGNGKTKTGDTAPVAALIIVAIAAFGTAVVVYRKKVNA